MSEVKLKTKKITCVDILKNKNSILINSKFNLSLEKKARDFFCSKSKFKRFNKGYKFDISSSNTIFLISNGEVNIVSLRKNKIIKKLKAGDFFALRKDFEDVYFLVNKNINVFYLEKQYVNTLFKLSPEIVNLILDFFIEIKRKMNNNITTGSY